MSTSKKDIIDFENKYKYYIYNKIDEIISTQSEFIMQLEKQGKLIDIDTNIPNIGITFYNKLNELSKTFQNVGISIFAEPNDKGDYVGTNFVGNAIIDDMISQLLNGVKTLTNYNSSLKKVANEKDKQVKALQTISPIKMLFLKIRSFFIPTTISDITSYPQEEIEEINTYLLEYKQIDNKLWQYNLKDNVIQSLVNLINDRRI